MNAAAEMRCRCGEVRAVVKDPSPSTVNRVICYCDDCQAYAHQLGRADLLDIHGGTDIVQVAPASLTFLQGQDKIAALRLSPKGLFRWYARCCNTPVGNTVSPSIPFVGLVAQSFASDRQTPDQLFGQPVGAILGKFATRDAKVPLFRFGFPVFDRVNKHRYPLIGYQGVVNMVTEICNKFIDIKDETCEDRYFELMR